MFEALSINGQLQSVDLQLEPECAFKSETEAEGYLVVKVDGGIWFCQHSEH